MKVISIGDLHGSDCWKKVFSLKNEFDKIVFIGDFCDSADYNENGVVVRRAYTNDEIFQNLYDIIEFKKANMDLVELLLGNHDISYMCFPRFFCQGFRADAQPSLNILFNNNRRLFDVAYQFKNYLWTHAGVTNKWLAEFKPMAEERGLWDDKLPLADILNMANETSLQEKLFQKSGRRMVHGDTDLVGGIVWSDRSETREDYLNNYNQIVGHTSIARNTTIEHNGSSITYIDSLHSEGGGFYELTITD
jgi:hypothetical protein